MNTNIRSIDQLLCDVVDRLNREDPGIKLSRLVDLFHERGFGFFLFLFALPAALPLPGLGINFVVAAPLLFLTLQQTVGRQSVWFPRRLGERQISRDRFLRFVEKAQPYLKMLERLLSPRLGWVTQGLFSNAIGACGLLFASSILIPLPLTNTVPAMGIALMALGVLMRDGLAVIAGMAVGLFWVTMLALVVVILGVEGVEAIKGFVKGLI